MKNEENMIEFTTRKTTIKKKTRARQYSSDVYIIKAFQLKVDQYRKYLDLTIDYPNIMIKDIINQIFEEGMKAFYINNEKINLPE
jgi:hypothetical protein